jgi:uncharacterized protein
MQSALLYETFGGTDLHPALKWLNPPPTWRLDAAASRLVVYPAAYTDFWQRTHYGFQADNGHLLHMEIPGDAVITARIHSFPVHQYDQAGLMVRFSADCWLKTSVEFELEEPSKLGVVVTNHGYSDWSLQDYSHDRAAGYRLRVRRKGGDFLVEYTGEDSGRWQLLRVTHLSAEPGSPAWGGFYACSPKGEGFRAEVEYLKIETSEAMS